MIIRHNVDREYKTMSLCSWLCNTDLEQMLLNSTLVLMLAKLNLELLNN